MTGFEPLLLPRDGDHGLLILAPTVLEAVTFAGVSIADLPPIPSLSKLDVRVGGESVPLATTGLKRRVARASQIRADVLVSQSVFIRLMSAIPPDVLVEVFDGSGRIWPSNFRFSATNASNRWSPAIHVDQVGYVPTLAKVAIVGYSLGSLGEMVFDDELPFRVVNVVTGRVAWSGRLSHRPENGLPPRSGAYSHVSSADFTSFREVGRYRLVIDGLGASTEFDVSDDVTAANARAYGLGLYHQRCGATNSLPFTRFAHAACHLAPAAVPTSDSVRVNEMIRAMEGPNADTSRALLDIGASHFPFLRAGHVDVHGGHHDAGDYGKYVVNSAMLVHTLIFAVDVLPGVADLDNLGLPESGDGRSDLAQVALWEADFLVRMQDADGGFSTLVRPRERPYETDVLPDAGDAQFIYPKTTTATAAAVACLAEAGSSALIRRISPESSDRFLAASIRGWAFLERAWDAFGRDGAYQKVFHYGDRFEDVDEVIWAETAMFLATKDPAIHKLLLSNFDPSSKATRHWGWVRLGDAYGCAIRAYAFAVISGRARTGELDPTLLARCQAEIRAAADELVASAEGCSYATSFPFPSKRSGGAGWYFADDAAFDLVSAHVLTRQPQYIAAAVGNLAFTRGTNPNNVVFLTGFGRLRPTEVVSQFARNDLRILPPSGLPVGSLQSGFERTALYGDGLGSLSFPPDNDPSNATPLYDRWADCFNTRTEATIVAQGRGLAATAYLMARTPLRIQRWMAAPARIEGLVEGRPVGTAMQLSLVASRMDLSLATVIWEARDLEEPVVGTTFVFRAIRSGSSWIEAEAVLPDGRRIFASTTVEVD